MDVCDVEKSEKSRLGHFLVMDNGQIFGTLGLLEHIGFHFIRPLLKQSTNVRNDQHDTYISIMKEIASLTSYRDNVTYSPLGL